MTVWFGLMAALNVTQTDSTISIDDQQPSTRSIAWIGVADHQEINEYRMIT